MIEVTSWTEIEQRLGPFLIEVADEAVKSVFYDHVGQPRPHPTEDYHLLTEEALWRVLQAIDSLQPE